MFGDSVNPGGSDAETGNQDHTTPSDPTTLAEAPAFADADMMAALGELSDGYTVNWRTLRPDKWPTAQTELTEWVEWIIYRYALYSRQLPSCWTGHGALVEELSALHSAWQADFHPADTGAGPIGWHERFELALGRIKNRWYGGECGRAHQPPNLGRPTNTEPVPPWHSPIRPGPAPDTAPDPMTQTGSAADEENRKRETP